MTAINANLIRRNDTPVVLVDYDQLKCPLADVQAYLLTDPEALAARQALFRDIWAQPVLLEQLKAIYERLDGLSYYATLGGNEGMNSVETTVYSLLNLRTFTEFVDYIVGTCLPAIRLDALSSAELRGFFDSIAAYAETERFLAARRWLDEFDIDLKHVRSITLGANLDAQLRIKEIGLASFNAHAYVNDNLIDAFFRLENPPAEYKCLAALGMQEVKNLRTKGGVAINKEYFDAMNGIFKGAIRSVRKYITDAFRRDVMSILDAKEDIVFMIRAAKYMLSLREAKLTLTFPKVGKTTAIRGLCNPNLLDKCKLPQIVTNDVLLDAGHRLYVLTGPNCGGKSVYLSAIGIAQVMFQLGLPVAAEAAEMQPFDVIATMFVREIVRSTESRLVNEVVRLRDTLGQIGENSLLLMDETFSSTSAYDGVFLAEALIKYLLKLGCAAFYVTHLHELAERLPKFGGELPLHLLTAHNDGGRRTYKIIPYDGTAAESSLARDIVIENGLGFLFA